MEFINYMADCSDDESSSDDNSVECDNCDNSGKRNFINDRSSSSEEEDGYVPPNPYVS